MALSKNTLATLSSKLSNLITVLRNSLRNQGLVLSIKKIFKYFLCSKPVQPQDIQNNQYELWQQKIERPYLSRSYADKELKLMAQKPKFSIIFPVWNKNRELLEKALQSICKQYYENWEICFSDGSNSRYRHIADRVSKDYQEKLGEKFKVSGLEKELRTRINIIENTNNAIQLATGQYCVFMDCDDELAPNCLLELAKVINNFPNTDFIYSDFDKKDLTGERTEPSFWPDWSPHMSEVQMYTTHVTCYRKELLDELGGLRKGTEGCQDWDLALRAAERTDNIVHIPKILYHWRVYPGSTALANSGAKDWAYENQKKMLKDYLGRKNYKGKVIQNKYEGLWRIKFNIRNGQEVAVIVLADGDLNSLRASLTSIVENTEYEPITIYILTEVAGSELQEKLNIDFKDIKYSIETLDKAAIKNRRGINRVIENIDSDHIAFIDESVRVHRGWLSPMLEYSQRKDVGMVGGKLVLPDGRIWYAGTILGINGWRGYSHRFLSGDISGYNGWLMSVRNVISVSSDFMMIKTNLFKESGGFDEKLPVKTRDLDLGIELHEKGYLNVYTSFAHAYYKGEVSIVDGEEMKTKRGYKDFIIKRDKYFRQGCKADPFYNKNLSCDYEDFRLNV